MEQLLKEEILELTQILSRKSPQDYQAMIGFDGFVDQILHVVNIRKNAEEYERMNSIRSYGERISNAAGLSTNIEMVRVHEKLGGNGPILANALGVYGVNLTCIGTLGYPTIHEVFKPMESHCTLYSIGNPGLSDAVEFDDGKIIVGKLDTLKNVNWMNILKTLGRERLLEMMSNSKLIGFENWTMLPYMSEIWKSMLSEILPDLPPNLENRTIFFDLCDPEKRTPHDLLEALELIQKFSTKFQVILGLNFREAILIAKVLGFTGYEPNHSKNVDLEKLVKLLSQTLGIYSVVVHPTTEAGTIIEGEYFHIKGPYTPKPKLTTGAGDNFNAGFCLGQILNCTPKQSLILGVCTSGYYVRNAKSPNIIEVQEFMQKWVNDLLEP